MSRRYFSKFVCFAVLAAALSSVPARSADEGAASGFSPYTVFALGDIPMPGTAYNRTMAGVGIASRNNKYINPLNPAAITARDSLAFMVDFSLFGENRIFRQGDKTSANNLFNIGDCIISFPIWKSLAMMVGIMPYSTTGYDYTYTYTDPAILADYGNVTFSSKGLGSVYQMFAGIGATPFRNLSVGAEAIYYFGNIKKTDLLSYSAADRQNIDSYYSSDIRALAGKFGVQYEMDLGKSRKLGLGATYRMSTNVNGYLEKSTATTFNQTVTDTLSKTPGRIKLSNEFGFGISYNDSDKLRAEIDYTLSDWTNTNFDTDPFFALEGDNHFRTTVSSSLRAGVEYTPNRNDVRYYFRKVAYRAGIYHTDEYYMISGNKVKSTGITLGATFPIYRWYNGLTIGLDLGRRGSLENNPVRETYFNFSVAVNLFDIWFQKPKYD